MTATPTLPALLAAFALSLPAAAATPAAVPPSAPANGPMQPLVFVIAMENHDARDIYGQDVQAPYINEVLMRRGARAENFVDELPAEVPSEPHYVWMEAGTNAFPDTTFLTDADPSARNNTAATAHLATQLRDTHGRVDWRAYQEAMDVPHTGACPVRSHRRYAAKHDPFVFFQDVAGNPPSSKNAYCAAHHADYATLASDLAANRVAAYNYITPDLCHDMHGARGCTSDVTVAIGDRWLREEMPALMRYVDAHDGVIFITWDEPEGTTLAPFLALGPRVKAGYAGHVRYTHGSLLKTVEEILRVPVLPAVARETDLADLFEPGALP